MYLQKSNRQKNLEFFFFWGGHLEAEGHWRVSAGSGVGSGCPWYGSADQDPYKNRPEHCHHVPTVLNAGTLPSHIKCMCHIGTCMCIAPVYTGIQFFSSEFWLLFYFMWQIPNMSAGAHCIRYLLSHFMRKEVRKPDEYMTRGIMAI
jgi:hypothetical protein